MYPPPAAPPVYPPPVPPGYAPPGYAPPGYAPPGYAPPAYAPPAYAPRAPEQPPPAPSLWYGWQTLLAVAPLDIAMFVGAARFGQSGGTESFVTGFVARNFAPAVVHLFHRRPGLAFGSVGLHAASTATGVAVGYAIGIALQGACTPTDPCRNGFRGVPPGPEYGAIAGSMVGTLLDVIFLAHRPRSTVESQQIGSTFVVAPFAAPTAGGLAASGVF